MFLQAWKNTIQKDYNLSIFKVRTSACKILAFEHSLGPLWISVDHELSDIMTLAYFE